MSYITTKEECAKQISGVCSCCGGDLEPLETVDNSGRPTFWVGCSKCMRFDNGTTKEVYEIARRMVTERHFYPSSTIWIGPGDSEELREYKIQYQTSYACSVVSQVLFFYNEIKNTTQKQQG